MRLEAAMQSRSPDVASQALQSQFIRAGAGAGKTRRLIHSFLDFAEEFRRQNDRLPRIIMTTFTRKATQEVKERLLVEALKRGQKDLFEYINKKSFVHISTIHGVLSLLLSQQSDRMRFPQDIKIVDDVQFARILKKQMNEIFKRHPEYIDLLETYSFTELVDLSKYALELKAQNHQLAYVTAAELRAASAQKKKHMIQLIDEIFKLATPEKSWIAYFEYLGRIKISLEEGNDTEFTQLLEEKMRKPMWKAEKPSLDPVAHEILENLREEYFKSAFDSEEYIRQHEQLNSLFDRYLNDLFKSQYEHKRRTGQLTIGDLESLSLQMIEQQPEAVREFADSWDFFMIDEFQDTSPIQVKILNELIGRKPCFVVGDPQQSIYLFRGARSEVFELKQAEMTKAGARVDLLDTNYRSEPTLMNHINHLVAQVGGQFKPMKVKPEASPEKPTPFDTYFVKTSETAVGVIEQVRHLLYLGAKPQEICVLSRNNKALHQVAHRASEFGIPVQQQSAAGFEETREILDLMSFNRFLNNPHDDENFITLARSPWFYISDEQLLELADTRKLTRSSYWSALSRSKLPQKARAQHYLDLFDLTGILQTTQLFMRESNFLTYSRYYDSSGRREANVFKYIASLADAEKKPGFSLGLFLEEQFMSLQSDLGSGQGEAQPVEQPDCVTLMTIHASKGLQFKHVIVVGFNDTIQTTKVIRLAFSPDEQKYSLAAFDPTEQKIVPSRWAEDIRAQLNERELQESERVLYVALTRAIESLTLVADTEKKANKHSWSEKISWPEAGESDHPDFKTYSVEHNSTEMTYEKPQVTEMQARPLYRELPENQQKTESITELLQTTGLAMAKPQQELQLLNLKKAQYGTDLHRIFESMKYVEMEVLRKDLTVNDQAAIDYMLAQKDLRLAELLQHGHNEWGFGLKTRTRFIQGQIDLWAELPDEIHVLDYKTGSSFFSDKAFEQLSLYTMALLKMNQIPANKKIVHSVVYPIEKTLKQKTFLNAAEFQQKLSQAIQDIF